MKGTTLSIGIIFSVGLAFFMLSVITQIIWDVVAPTSGLFLRNAQVLRYQQYGSITEILTYHGPDAGEVKEDMEKILDLASKSPHEMAISPATAEINEGTFTQIDDALKSDEKVDKDILNSISSKCQAWLTINNPGAQDFALNDGMIGEFYSGLLDASTGGIKLLNPSTISQAVNENIRALEPLFVSGGGNTLNCAECWTLREEYLAATGDTDAMLEIEGRIRDKTCAQSCARVCENIYPTMRLLSLAHNMLAAEEGGESLQKALILTEITLD